MEFVVLIIVLIFRGLLGLMLGKRHDLWFFRLKKRASALFRPKAPHLYQGEQKLPEDNDRYEATSGETSEENTKAVWNRSQLGSHSARWFAGTGVFILSVVLPVAALSIFLAVLEGVAWGLPAFLLSIAVLLYSLGRKEGAYWLTRFQIAWRQKDLQGAFQYASEVIPQVKMQDEKQLYQKVFTRLIGISFQDFFLISFWFMVLGAEGALLARLMILFCEPQPGCASPEPAPDKIETVRHLFEWLPARLTGLAFMLTGHFVYCSQQWSGYLFDRKSSHEISLTRMALAALGEKVAGNTEAALQEISEKIHKDEQLQELEALLKRSSVLWVIAVAITVVLMEM